MIDSVYYGKVVEDTSHSRINKDFNFGYDQNSTSTNSSYSSQSSSAFREVSETQIQFMQSKISSIQVYFEDLKDYYNKQKNELESSSAATAPKKSSADLLFYWNKKIEQLG